MNSLYLDKIINIPIDDKEWNAAINFLVEHNFPDRYIIHLVTVRDTPERLSRIHEIGAFTQKLIKEPRHKIIELAQNIKNEQEIKARLNKEEWINNLPHNSPAAQADFNYWGKMDLWDCLEEGALLCLEINPQLFPWKTLEKYRFEDPKIASLFRIRDLISRAIETNEGLPAKTNPSEFIEWIEKKQIDFPIELKKEVKMFSKHRSRKNQNIGNLETLLKQEKSKTKRLQQEKASLSKMLKMAQKLLAGFVQLHYDFIHDSAGLGSAVSSLALNAHITVDDETLRSHLQEGLKKAPQLSKVKSFRKSSNSQN